VYYYKKDERNMRKSKKKTTNTENNEKMTSIENAIPGDIKESTKEPNANPPEADNIKESIKANDESSDLKKRTSSIKMELKRQSSKVQATQVEEIPANKPNPRKLTLSRQKTDMNPGGSFIEEIGKMIYLLILKG
jgi:hypothetical protein